MNRVLSFLARTLGPVQKALGFLLVVSGSAGTAMAISSVPEIDPGSIGNGLALVFGGLLLLTAMRRKR